MDILFLGNIITAVTIVLIWYLFNKNPQLSLRKPAMEAVLKDTGKNITEFGYYATAIFLIGWGTGGLIFGALGDRIGRAKTMMVCILIYSVCTGLSALSQGFWDFGAYRFLTGLGVGGVFAVGVTLVAETVPNSARAGARVAASAFDGGKRFGRWRGLYFGNCIGP